ncbi:hypothetical protein [Nonomuraea endophytica]|uniref:hypothetical protein n=1 Tax=Nonomuraea endophytica TaxID=714136 RepID=UPI0037C95E4F
MSGLYEKWFEAYVKVEKDPRLVAGLSCPSCGRTTLRLLFVVHPTDRSLGWAEFWCGACRQGIFFSRVSVPAGAETVSAEERRATQREDFEVIPPMFSSD